jgi:ABC-type transporter Mla MlaB component
MCAKPPDPDTSATIIVCDVGPAANLTAVHALACLALTARRLGCQVQLRSPSRELSELIELCGLAEVLPVVPPE